MHVQHTSQVALALGWDFGALAFGDLSFTELGVGAATRSILAPGQTLKRGEQLTSPNGRFKAVMQTDGNFVIYGPGNSVLRPWMGAGDTASMNTDGNFVLYSGGHDTWASDTAGNGGARLLMQNDGNLVVYSAPAAGNRALWESETSGGRVYEPSRSLINILTAPARSAAEAGIYASTGQHVTVTSVSVSPAQLAAAIQAVISFVPGIGAGINAAIAAGAALAQGENITDALVDGAKNALPGGPIARQAFDSGVAAVKAIANGQNIGDAALAATREALPGDEAKHAFDVGLAIAHGQNVQQALIDGGMSIAGKAVAALGPIALPPALTEIAKSLPPEATRLATTLFNRPELQALPAAAIAQALHSDTASATRAIQAVNAAKKRPPVVLKAPPALQKKPLVSMKAPPKPLVSMKAPPKRATPPTATARAGFYPPYPKSMHAA